MSAAHTRADADAITDPGTNISPDTGPDTSIYVGADARANIDANFFYNHKNNYGATDWRVSALVREK